MNDKNQVSINTFTGITDVNGDINIVKKGNVATLCLTFNQFTVPNGAWNNIVIIPEGFRPALLVRGQRVYKTDKTVFEFQINPGNGQFILRNSEHNTQTTYGLLYIECSYVCA